MGKCSVASALKKRIKNKAYFYLKQNFKVLASALSSKSITLSEISMVLREAGIKNKNGSVNRLMMQLAVENNYDASGWATWKCRRARNIDGQKEENIQGQN